MEAGMKNIALLTSSPKGAELKKALLAKAVSVGHILIQRFRLGVAEYLPFTEVTHYFGPDMRELGMIGFAHSSVETVFLHDPPRQWGEPMLARCEIRQNFWNKQFDK